MTKEMIIYRIESIIEEWGTFSVFDVEATQSPVIGTLGCAVMLAEFFGLHGTEGYLYLEGEDSERDIQTYHYTELDMDCLTDILKLAEDWEAQNLKTEKRIS